MLHSMGYKISYLPQFGRFQGKYVLVHILSKVCILGVLMVRHRASNGKMNKIDKNRKTQVFILVGQNIIEFLDFIKNSHPIHPINR